jgi:hypothetical protein
MQTFSILTTGGNGKKHRDGTSSIACIDDHRDELFWGLMNSNELT